MEWFCIVFRYRIVTTWLAALATWMVAAGCGTTRTSDTNRTATEQLLISDAIDRAVGDLHLVALSGQTVYLDDRYLSEVVDRNYLVSSLRQQLLANGCVLHDDRNEADFIVEARAGAVGTNRHDLLFGIPSTNVPQIFPFQGVPAAIPEVPLAKRRDQRAIVKVAVFAYHRETGTPVWQSGIAQEESSFNDVWLFGAGPFEHGSIDKRPAVAAATAHSSGDKENDSAIAASGPPNVAAEALFISPQELLARREAELRAVQLAEHHQPAAVLAEPRTLPPEVIAPEPRHAIPLPATSALPAQHATGPGMSLFPGPQHTGSFYSMERGSLISRDEQMRFLAPNDLVPLPSPIVDIVQ